MLMRKITILLILIFSTLIVYSQSHKNISLEEKATNIISKLKEVQDLEKLLNKTNRTVSYISDNETKTSIEISVCENAEDRMIRIYFYKYCSNGKLYKINMEDGEYKLIKIET